MCAIGAAPMVSLDLKDFLCYPIRVRAVAVSDDVSQTRIRLREPMPSGAEATTDGHVEAEQLAAGVGYRNEANAVCKAVAVVERRIA